MKKVKIILTLIGLPISIYCQVLWNEPPDTIWYGNQSRWVEIILPIPQNFVASSINNNQVKLTWNEYWTQEMFDAYLNKFGYVAIPNRFSLYRQNITNGELQLQSLDGVNWHKTEYIDTNVELGKEYLYKIMSSDQNYLTIDRLQHWSPRSFPTNIIVGSNPVSLACPSNFTGFYIPSPASIKMTWDSVPNATSYTIFKSYISQDTGKMINLALPVGNICQYLDSDINPIKEYYYSIIALNNNGGSDRATTIAITSGAMDFKAPNNFSGRYESNSAMIILSWDYIKDANSYIIFKSFDPFNLNQWQHLAIPVGDVNKYFDSELLPYVEYVYTIIAVNGNIKSDRTSPPIIVTSGTLSIENEEYWEAVEEYEKDRKLGWLGCSAK